MGASAAGVSGWAGALELVVRLQTACATILAGIWMAGIRFGAYSSRIARLADATGAASADYTSTVILAYMLIAGLAAGILIAAIGTIAMSIEAIRTTTHDRFGNILAMRSWMTDLLAIT